MPLAEIRWCKTHGERATSYYPPALGCQWADNAPVPCVVVDAEVTELVEHPDEDGVALTDRIRPNFGVCSDCNGKGTITRQVACSDPHYSKKFGIGVGEVSFAVLHTESVPCSSCQDES